MSIFASETSVTIPIPFDPPHTATIRKLTGIEYDRAQAEHLGNTIAGRSSRGWADRFQQLLQTGQATDLDAQRAIDDPLNGFDRATIVRAGLLAWSYTAPVEGAVQPKAVTPAAVADLDDEALEYFARAIMRLTKPALVQAAEEREAARKNA